MKKTFFEKIKYWLLRRGDMAREDFNLSLYVNKHSPKIEKEPFPHVIIDNFFKDDFFQELHNYYLKCLDSGLFSPLENYKSGFSVDFFSPNPHKDNIVNIFFSLAWNDYFARIFKQTTSKMTLLIFHHHKKLDGDSQVHTDYARDTFLLRDKLSNGVAFFKKSMVQGGGVRDKNVCGVRKIAIVFYFGVDNGKEDKGRTLFYKNDKNFFVGQDFDHMYQQIKANGPVKSVKPIKNRLLAFEVSPNSFHSVETNTEPRNTFVQWLYVDPALCNEDYAINTN